MGFPDRGSARRVVMRPSSGGRVDKSLSVRSSRLRLRAQAAAGKLPSLYARIALAMKHMHQHLKGTNRRTTWFGRFPEPLSEYCAVIQTKLLPKTSAMPLVVMEPT